MVAAGARPHLSGRRNPTAGHADPDAGSATATALTSVKALSSYMAAHLNRVLKIRHAHAFVLLNYCIFVHFAPLLLISKLLPAVSYSNLHSHCIHVPYLAIMEYLLILIVIIILSSLLIKLLQVQAAKANPHGVQNSAPNPARNLILVIDALRQRAIQFFVAARLPSKLQFYYWILSALLRVVKSVSIFLDNLISLVLRSNQADLGRGWSFTPMSTVAESDDSDNSDADASLGSPSSPTVANNSHDIEPTSTEDSESLPRDVPYPSFSNSLDTASRTTEPPLLFQLQPAPIFPRRPLPIDQLLQAMSNVDQLEIDPTRKLTADNPIPSVLEQRRSFRSHAAAKRAARERAARDQATEHLQRIFSRNFSGPNTSNAATQFNGRNITYSSATQTDDRMQSPPRSSSPSRAPASDRCRRALTALEIDVRRKALPIEEALRRDGLRTVMRRLKSINPQGWQLLMAELETEEKIPSRPLECHVNQAVVDWEETVAFKLALAYAEKYNLVLPISGKEPWTRDDHACEEEVFVERDGDGEDKERAVVEIKEEGGKKDESIKDPLALPHHLGSVCEETLSLFNHFNSLCKEKEKGSDEGGRGKEEQHEREEDEYEKERGKQEQQQEEEEEEEL